MKEIEERKMKTHADWVHFIDVLARIPSGKREFAADCVGSFRESAKAYFEIEKGLYSSKQIIELIDLIAPPTL